jgi:hypothetical protein
MSPRYDRRLTENLSHPWRVHHYLDRPFSFFLSTSLHTDYHQNSYRSNHGICPNRPNPHTDFRIIEPYTPTAVHGSPKHTKGRKRRKRSGQELCLSLRNPDPDLIHTQTGGLCHPRCPKDRKPRGRDRNSMENAVARRCTREHHTSPSAAQLSKP